jgi:hypothetical protein
LQPSFPFYTFTTADVGTHTFAVTLRTSGSQSISASDYINPSISGTQSGIYITPGAATSVSVTALHATVAGVSQPVTVAAHDAFGNIAASYAGTVLLSSSDTQAALPAAYAFTAADAGTHTFDIALKSSGGQTFTVQDALSGTVLYSQRDIAVSAAAMAGFAFRSPTNATAGAAFSLTLSAVDAFGNTITGYTGKIHFSGPSGGGNLLPADYTFTAADAGTHLFSVTLASTGTQTLTVGDTANAQWKSSMSITVKSGTTSTGGGGGGTATGGGGTSTGGGGTATGGGTGGGGKKIVV